MNENDDDNEIYLFEFCDSEGLAVCCIDLKRGLFSSMDDIYTYITKKSSVTQINQCGRFLFFFLPRTFI